MIVALPTLLLAGGCTPAGPGRSSASSSDAAAAPDAAERVRWLAAIRSGDCESIQTEALRDDCWVTHAERAAEPPCEHVASATLRGECWFRVAEHRNDPALCPKATPYAEDCALHVLSTSFRLWVPPDARPGDGEAEVERRITASGLSADDPRPWSAYYRWVLGQQHPLDRAGCANASNADRRDACEHTGVALYNDLLNYARDRHTYPCDGGALPPALATTPDPELDALRASRADLCPR